MEKKIIKIDCDGVLRDLLYKMCEVYNRRYGTNLQPHEVTDFDVGKIFTKCEEVDNIPANTWLFKNNGNELFFNSPMMDGAKEAMDMLHELGYYIVIVTHQQTLDNKIDTLNWLAKYGIYYYSICFTNQKQIIKGHIHVDDHLYYLNQTEEREKICITAPHNESDKSFKRFNSLLEFVKSLTKPKYNVGDEVFFNHKKEKTGIITEIIDCEELTYKFYYVVVVDGVPCAYLEKELELA